MSFLNSTKDAYICHHSNRIAKMSLLKSNIYILVFSFSIIFFGCQSELDSDPPNIVWITAEDIGPALGCYGDEYARTPNLDQLASEGVLYRKAFASAPICAPSRSCLITGLYATSLGTQHLRSEIPIPDFIKTIPEHLRQKGYYCTNNSKTDYNFDPSGRWDENGNEAHWRNRPEETPFFSVFNYGTTHEGQANSSDTAIFETLEFRHDPENAELPPYFPETEEFKKLWARQHDLISVLDQQAGDIINQLKEDGLYDNTIIFFFSDHGYGFPRYKRWMYNSGIEVPLIVKIPEKYQKFSENSPGSENQQLVSFVDFAPTVLNLAGVEIPAVMEGQPFLGPELPEPRKFVFGARSRADDVYDVSRAVTNGRYIYIRNFMPHKPYVQKALIFSDQKRSYAELNSLHEKGELQGYAQEFYKPKATEELYDLASDPFELNNIAKDESLNQIKDELKIQLKDWMLKTHDTGLLHESEMMIRTGDSSTYQMARSDFYHVAEILASAETVQNPDIRLEKILSNAQHPDSGVRFWAVMALQADEEKARLAFSTLAEKLADESPAVALIAAETLIRLNEQEEKAIPVIEKYLQWSNQPTVVLQAAMVCRRLGDKAAPLVPVIKQEYPKYQGEIWGRYKSWSYPMFIGFAFDQTLINCGQDISIEKI